MNRLKQLILKHDPNFFKNLDPNLKILASEIKKMLREQDDCVMAVTGYPGKGKSNATAILGILIDENYEFGKNICFIPSSKEIENKYLNLPMYSFFHIDEASRGLHKQKWYEKVQQTLNVLYDTEREGHFLCTALIMPRFQNFTENFRNFRIVYWINIVTKGICIAYRKDEDKDAKDPWHIDDNYKTKSKYWKGKKVFERGIGDIIRVEQKTPNYWFYFEVPAIPEEVWKEYQDLKKQSRIDAKEREKEIETESYRDRIQREKMEKWQKIMELKRDGKTHVEIGAVMGLSGETIRRYMRQIEAYNKMIGAETHSKETNNNIYNHNSNTKFNKIVVDERKEQ